MAIQEYAEDMAEAGDEMAGLLDEIRHTVSMPAVLAERTIRCVEKWNSWSGRPVDRDR